MDEQLITIKEAAKRLTVSGRTVHRMVCAKKLAAVRDGRYVRVLASSIEEYIENHLTEASFPL